jgi:pimeloyl-ACP methyl ester carboxylesterase
MIVNDPRRRLIHSSMLGPKNRRKLEVFVPDLNGTERRIVAEVTGDLSGDPSVQTAFIVGGSPTDESAAEVEGLSNATLAKYQLIHWSRPGYGQSHRLPARRVVDAVDDVLAIANALELSSFFVFGRSGGGPGALACAAEHHRFEGRLRRVGVAAGQAPPHLEHHQRYVQMIDQNLWNFGGNDFWTRLLQRAATEEAPSTHYDMEPKWNDEKTNFDIDLRAAAMRRSGSNHVRFLERQLEDFDSKQLAEFRKKHNLESDQLLAVREALYPDDPVIATIRKGFRSPDRDFLERDDVRAALALTYAAAARNGHEGWYDDWWSVKNPWGCDLTQIPSELPVDLHYFKRDRFVPAVNGILLRSEIEHARLFWTNGGHFDSYDLLPEILEFLTAPDILRNPHEYGGPKPVDPQPPALEL